MNPPTDSQVFSVMDATWPPARIFDMDGLCLREGKGGGKRVSAATANRSIRMSDLEKGEDNMRALGQTPLFMIRSCESALDELLDAAGYEVVDPVTIYAIPAADIAEAQPPAEAVESWPPLAIQKEIWRLGGIGPARVDVMQRATCSRTTILGRVDNRPAATVYIGASDGIAMLHALETRAEARRNGGGRRLMRAAAHWAASSQASWLTLAVTKANTPANELYRSLGMTDIASYHYRLAPETRS